MYDKPNALCLYKINKKHFLHKVQDEALKISEFLQNQGDFNDWDAAIRGIDKAREDLERSQRQDSRHNQERNQPRSGDRDYKYWDSSQQPHNTQAAGRRQNAEAEGSRNRNRNAGQKDKQGEDGFRQRRNSDGSRSRRDHRRKGSLNGRRSRDSSVSSVNSTRSYQSEGYDSWPRRRNRRRKSGGSNSGMRESSSRELLTDSGSMNLKVSTAFSTLDLKSHIETWQISEL